MEKVVSDQAEAVQNKAPDAHPVMATLTFTGCPDRFGFNNPDDYARAFGKVRGVSPMQYRHQLTD